MFSRPRSRNSTELCFVQKELLRHVASGCDPQWPKGAHPVLHSFITTFTTCNSHVLNALHHTDDDHVNTNPHIGLRILHLPHEPWERITYKHYGYFTGVVGKPVFGPVLIFYPPILHHGSLAAMFSNKSKISRSCPSSWSVTIFSVYTITCKLPGKLSPIHYINRGERGREKIF